MPSKKYPIETQRHTLAHVMAAAVQQIFPSAKFGIGPVIEDGFYYDFDLDPDPSHGDSGASRPLTERDFGEIEKRMRKIIAENLPVEHQYIPVADAIKDAKVHGQKYKLELLEEITSGKRLTSKEIDAEAKGGPDFVSAKRNDKIEDPRFAGRAAREANRDKISFYTIGKFADLCKGPHVARTGELPADGFKISHVAGAYWRGNEKNPQLQRLYAYAFETKKELDAHITLMKEAKKRDHRKLGQELGIFMFDDLVGKGLPLWLPNGTIVRDIIERFAVEKEQEYGYVRVATPHLAKEELYKTSGHLPYYADSMYPPMNMDDGTYYLKAMNCPHHHVMYRAKQRSYRDLPIRMAEYGTVYRNELSGTLAGLLRVRMLSMNDAHIYCTKEQVEEEFKKVLELNLEYFKVFGLKNYWFQLSKWNPRNKKKYIDEPNNWKYTEDVLRKILKKLKVKFVEADDEAAFYGPKVDVQIKSVVGREETLSTIQLDFAAKKRFGLTYKDKGGKDNNEVFVIHRAPLSTHERFMALLLEHYAGAFPLWLAPVQIAVLPITDKQNKFAQSVVDELKTAGIRVEANFDNESLGKKIRNAELQKIPYLAVIGEKEVKAKAVAIRKRGQATERERGSTETNRPNVGDTGQIKLDAFIKKLLEEIRKRQ